MTMQEIRKKEIYYMTVDDEEYTRWGENSWTFVMSYGIHAEDVPVFSDKSVLLERLFQEHKELI